ncbi:MAG: HaeIII family restriction endonuclease [Bacteroidetes bacterium]|nr:HaeIII family restriction endonuclease [Bacteroidota bacterium]
MSNVSQTESGKAWEYGLAKAFERQLRGKPPIKVNGPLTKSQKSFYRINPLERNKILRAACEAVDFMMAHDERLDNTDKIFIQSDMEGRHGDVRDIILDTHLAEVGISAKNRHNALKHSRLSDTIDFGQQWYRISCSEEYWSKVRPIFQRLQEYTEKGMKFSEITDKQDQIYLPILDAFIQETKRFADCKRMLRYLIGLHDFYKIIKENGTILIQSFNLGGTLKWGKKLPQPNRVIDCALKDRSKTTALMYMDEGWSLSFRIHNARSLVEPSVKFDVRLAGVPPVLTNHFITYDGD